jgi:AcrR family transcriptional regulator
MPKRVKPNPDEATEATTAATPRRRGRPRSLDARAAILRAARELLAETGLSGMTMEAVAARAGVGKPTVYRWWPDRHAVAMAALMSEPAPSPAAPRKRSALASLRRQLVDMAEVFATATGRNAARLIASADANSELSKAFRNHFVLARREEGRALILEAVADGELRRDLDVDVALDLIYGPLFFRLLLGHAPLDATAVGRIFKDALRGLA